MTKGYRHAPRTTETRSKIAKALSGRPLSPEHRLAISTALLSTSTKPGKPRDWTMDEVKRMTADQHSRPNGTYASKLTREEAWEIKFKLLPLGLPLNKIAGLYDVHWKSVSNIKHGRTWEFLQLDDYQL